MSLTQVDPVAALIVIDLQKGIVAFPTAHPSSEIIKRSAQLAQVFRECGLPVILVKVGPGGRPNSSLPKLELPPDWTDLVSELDPQPSDYLVTKLRIGAFVGTSLDEILRKHEVTQIFLAGIATSVAVEATGRCAYDFGYNVVHVLDAMTDIDLEAHRYCIESVFPRFGETDSTENVLKLLEPHINVRVSSASARSHLD
jgi:nicotinamidase-related amidase